MKHAALDVLVCPACKADLELDAAVVERREILDGTLTCTSCHTHYPIRSGVPRFVPDGMYASSFGWQWNWFRTVQLDSATGTSRSEDALLSATGWSDDVYPGRRLLDAGVGAGRFAERAASKGAEVFGVDLTSAVDAAYRNIGERERVHLIQADIFALPFRADTFDLAYSIGVLHHTPDPAVAFRRVADVVRPGGRFAVYLYSRYGIAHRMSDVIRPVTTRLPLSVMWALSAAAVPLYYAYRLPVVGTIANLALPISMERDWHWRWLDTFDWYTPKYQFKYLYPEIFRWYQDAGFHELDIFGDPVRMSGQKRSTTEESNGRQRWRDLVAS
ncbi:MAG TPA: methyltransferase domain-containing protein [Vicinamibacterales bacterium]